MNPRTLTKLSHALRHRTMHSCKAFATSARGPQLHSLQQRAQPPRHSLGISSMRFLSLTTPSAHSCGSKASSSSPCTAHKSSLDHHFQQTAKSDGSKDSWPIAKASEMANQQEKTHPCDPCPVSKGKGVCDALQCWSCAHFLDKNQLFCMKCSRIQPPQEANYFDMFGLTPSFEVDLDVIQKKYWQLSKQVHPDRFNKGTEQEQHFSASQTMLLNTAYNTLKQPHLRAVYLLGLNGIEIAESESLTDEMFLMEIMEIREAVESAQGVEELQQLKQENEERIQQCLKAIEKQLKLQLWERAKGLIAPLQYYMKIRETIVDKMPM
eukprot:TRINITY_DN3405_c0_g4_i1.p1 TRINITY_DN3405_c0_g4~~TRINITY_DN3405_c0_g4_i1.p1  ORF type:complete len:323 (-),score=76.30 TRINITY_DN3405_c0_g4_i1:151-1119(-)